MEEEKEGGQGGGCRTRGTHTLVWLFVDAQRTATCRPTTSAYTLGCHPSHRRLNVPRPRAELCVAGDKLAPAFVDLAAQYEYSCDCGANAPCVLILLGHYGPAGTCCLTHAAIAVPLAGPSPLSLWLKLLLQYDPPGASPRPPKCASLHEQKK